MEGSLVGPAGAAQESPQLLNTVPISSINASIILEALEEGSTLREPMLFLDEDEETREQILAAAVQMSRGPRNFAFRLEMGSDDPHELKHRLLFNLASILDAITGRQVGRGRKVEESFDFDQDYLLSTLESVGHSFARRQAKLLIILSDVEGGCKTPEGRDWTLHILEIGGKIREEGLPVVMMGACSYPTWQETFEATACEGVPVAELTRAEVGDFLSRSVTKAGGDGENFWIDGDTIWRETRGQPLLVKLLIRQIIRAQLNFLEAGSLEERLVGGEMVLNRALDRVSSKIGPERVGELRKQADRRWGENFYAEFSHYLVG